MFKDVNRVEQLLIRVHIGESENKKALKVTEQHHDVFEGEAKTKRCRTVASSDLEMRRLMCSCVWHAHTKCREPATGVRAAL